MLDYKAPHSMLEWLADAQHVGTNNPNNLPAYTTYDAGVTAQLTRGTLTFAATQHHQHLRRARSRARPMRCRSRPPAAYVIPNIARPLSPRTYSLTYSARFGQGVSRRRRRRRFSRAAAAGGGGGLLRRPDGPGGGGPGGPGGGRGFDRSSRRCRRRRRPIRSLSAPIRRRAAATNAAKARQLSGELKAYVAQIEAARTAAGYPATMPAPALDRRDDNLSRTGHDLRAHDHAEGRRRGCARSRDACRCTSRAATTSRSANSTRRRARSSSCRSSTSCRRSASTSSRASRRRGKRCSASTSCRRRRRRTPFEVRTSRDVHRSRCTISRRKRSAS